MYFISLSIWDIPVGFKWFLFIMLGTFPGLAGLLMAWAHEICTGDSEERALVVAAMNEMGYVVQAWLPNIVWQQVTAPEYTTGYITAACLSLLFLLNIVVVWRLQRREEAA